jgi:hypothetical protein
MVVWGVSSEEMFSMEFGPEFSAAVVLFEESIT